MEKVDQVHEFLSVSLRFGEEENVIEKIITNLLECDGMDVSLMDEEACFVV